MFKRKIETFLSEWKNKANRKPLIIRGARQVGKTSVIQKFGREHFDHFIYLNLEKEEDVRPFNKMQSIKEVINYIEISKNMKIEFGKTLLFIDEIQTSGIAMTQLRYFFEEYPDLHVIAAGSLLEVKMGSEGFSFPVGRVEYAYLHPANFEEYLMATSETQTLNYLKTFNINDSISESLHESLLNHYWTYFFIGGMPEALWTYIQTGSLKSLDSIYESLMTGYSDDVFKYSKHAKARYVQHIIDTAHKYCGTEITYERFGASSFKSRDISDAFDILEKSMLVNRVHATHSTEFPFEFNMKKRPKLLFIDTGLVNHKLGIRTKPLDTLDLNNLYKGRIAEQIVGQELLFLKQGRSNDVGYWYRGIPGSTSQIDYLISVGERLIPIEVKSGRTGTLKSVFQFVDESNTDFCVRVYSGVPRQDKLVTKKGNHFTLLSIPFYLVFRIEELSRSFIKHIA